MTEVIIDGVRYLPAHELTPPTLADVRRLLIELVMGDESIVGPWAPNIGETLWIQVSEYPDPARRQPDDLEPTIDRFIEMATERLLVKP